MKRISEIVILILAFGIVSFAQDEIHIADPRPFDSFGKLSLNDQKGRLDNFFVALVRDPKAKGIIIFQLDKKESKAKKRKRFLELSRHFNYRRIDKSRFTIIVYEGDEELTTFWHIPKNIDWSELVYFEDKDYKSIKGDEFQQKIDELFPKK